MPEEMAAWEELVRQYQHQIYRYVKKTVHEDVMAEDITQEVFVEAFRSWSRFRGDASARVWLFQVATHQIAKYLRDNVGKAKRTRSLDAPRFTDEGEARYEEIPDWSFNPEVRLMKDEGARLVREGLEALPFEYRATVYLRVVEGLSYDEIARTVKCSLGTVKSRIHNGRIRLAQWIKERL